MLEVQLPADGQLVVPMSWDEFEQWSSAIDLPYKVEWYDELCVMTRPVIRHAVVVSELLRVLMATCPPELLVLPEAAWHSPAGFFVPDLLVCHDDVPVDAHLSVPPLLAVEVLSPSTRRTDLTTKRELYAAHGLPWYWVADPQEPSLTVMRRVEGELREMQVIGPGEVAVTMGPVAASIAPDRLVRRDRPSTG